MRSAIEDGTLVDITPHEARATHSSFIRHNGSMGVFVAMALEENEMETIVPVVTEFLQNTGKAA